MKRGLRAANALVLRASHFSSATISDVVRRGRGETSCTILSERSALAGTESPVKFPAADKARCTTWLEAFSAD